MSMSSETESSSPREVQFTPEFRRNLRQLAKKYRRIRSDLQPTIEAQEIQAILQESADSAAEPDETREGSA